MSESSHTINDRISGVIWDFLERTLYSALNGFLDESHEVIIISPYIRDIDNPHFVSKGPMSDILTTAEIRSNTKVTEILISIARQGCKVKLMTAPFGKRFGKDNPDFNEEESKMLEKLKSAGIEIKSHQNNHAKNIVTPVGIITGSANFTNAALFWNIEQITIHHLPANQTKLSCMDLWSQGKYYSDFSTAKSIQV